jgi:hypothetical protein
MGRLWEGQFGRQIGGLGESARGREIEKEEIQSWENTERGID